MSRQWKGKKFYIFKKSHNGNCFTVLFNTLQQYVSYFSVQMRGEYIFLADLAAGNSGTN